MGDFFHGRRRKMAIAALVMALAIVGGWIRSRTRYDVVCVRSGIKTLYGVQSIGGGIDFYRCTMTSETNIDWQYVIDSKEYFCVDENGRRVDYGSPLAGHTVQWEINFAGFHFSDSDLGDDPYQHCVIPYWSIVLPLTLLSAYLLLSKPRRKSTPAKST